MLSTIIPEPAQPRTPSVPAYSPTRVDQDFGQVPVLRLLGWLHGEGDAEPMSGLLAKLSKSESWLSEVSGCGTRIVNKDGSKNVDLHVKYNKYT